MTTFTSESLGLSVAIRSLCRCPDCCVGRFSVVADKETEAAKPATPALRRPANKLSKPSGPWPMPWATHHSAPVVLPYSSPMSRPDPSPSSPPGTVTRWFPCSLLSACRRRSPALPQRHRHGYAADLPRGLPGQRVNPAQKIPATPAHPAGKHRARPRSARFEPVTNLKDVITPVPRVLLFVLLAGPAPSGSAGPSRLCQGCFPPSPAPPGSGCPQLQPPAATGRRWRSLSPIRNNSASRRTYSVGYSPGRSGRGHGY